MAAWILVWLNLIRVATLPPVPIEILTDIVKCHLDRVRAHAKVCIGDFFANCIDIVFELHSKVF